LLDSCSTDQPLSYNTLFLIVLKLRCSARIKNIIPYRQVIPLNIYKPHTDGYEGVSTLCAYPRVTPPLPCALSMNGPWDAAPSYWSWMTSQGCRQSWSLKGKCYYLGNGARCVAVTDPDSVRFCIACE